MANDQQFCLRWNNHQSTLISVFDSLLENGTLVDCTLAAEGQYLKAHKVVLSACSPYLETLLSQHYEKHPIVILKDVKFTELKSMMDYMYRGEVNISQDQLGTFLKAAESLQIKGLSDNGDDARDVGSTQSKRPDPPSRPSVTQTRTPVESKRPAPSGDISDTSRDGSISPSSLRKRRRMRRPSQGDDPDSHLDTTNSCDLPSQAQSTPLPVPSSTVVPTPVQTLPKQIKQEQPSSISRLDTSLNSSIAPESGLLKEKIEPPSEPLLEPKTEYLDYMNNENSIEVEDLTLDDDEEDLDSSMDASRAGPSHGDMSNQGYPPWQMTGDQSGTDEIFMAAQEAVGAATQQQRDSQEYRNMKNGIDPLETLNPLDALDPLASPTRIRTRGSSPENFLGFEDCDIIGKPEIRGVIESRVRLNKPRVSKSRASQVWQKNGRMFDVYIKEEPEDDTQNTKKADQDDKTGIRILNVSHGELGPIRKRGAIKKSSFENTSVEEIKNVKTKIVKQKLNYKPDTKKNNTDNTGTQAATKVERENEGKFVRKRKKTSNSGNKTAGFKCETCGKVYRYLRGKRQHQKLECNVEPQFPCPYCPSRYRYRQGIREHVRNYHEQAFPKWYAMHYVVPMLKRESLPSNN